MMSAVNPNNYSIFIRQNPNGGVLGSVLGDLQISNYFEHADLDLFSTRTGSLVHVEHVAPKKGATMGFGPYDRKLVVRNIIEAVPYHGFLASTTNADEKFPMLAIHSYEPPTEPFNYCFNCIIRLSPNAIVGSASLLAMIHSSEDFTNGLRQDTSFEWSELDRKLMGLDVDDDRKYWIEAAELLCPRPGDVFPCHAIQDGLEIPGILYLAHEKSNSYFSANLFFERPVYLRSQDSLNHTVRYGINSNDETHVITSHVADVIDIL